MISKCTTGWPIVTPLRAGSPAPMAQAISDDRRSGRNSSMTGHASALLDGALAGPGRGRPGGEHGDGGDFRRGQVVPVQAGGAALRLAFDDFVGGDDQVHAEVVLGLRYGLVNHLERMDG